MNFSCALASKRGGFAQVPVAVLLGVLGSAAVNGQSGTGTITLGPGQTEIRRLGPDVPSTTAVFPIDDADRIVVSIIASAEGLTTSILGPAAEVLDPTTIGSYGGTFFAFEGWEEPTGFLIFPASIRGHHYDYEFPSLGPGLYTVNLSVYPPPMDDIAVVAQVLTDSALGASLFATETTLVQGQTSVLVAALFDGTTPITGATVGVWLKPPTGSASTFVLLDNGVHPDTAAADGLYSGMFTAAQVGEYMALATMTGLSNGNVPFSRQGAATVDVVAPSATYTGASFTDQGVDTNGNGKFERLRIDRPVSVTAAGDYIFTVTLETALGKELRAYGRQTLSAGAQVASAYVEAPAILAAGEDGPYTIRAAELLYVGPNGAVPADRLYGGTQQTQAYLLSQFERPPIVFTGVTSDRGIDTDSDGDFDLLEVKVQVRVTLTGTYRYVVSLENGCEGVIESLRGEQQISSGAVQDLVLNFAGARIGARGMDGPYLVRNLFFTGPMGPNATSISLGMVGETQAYAGSQFDAYTAAPDCNLNGVPDECDLENCPAGDPDCQDCNENGIPDECDIANCPPGNPACQDCNESGVPDGCETAADGVISA